MLQRFDIHYLRDFRGPLTLNTVPEFAEPEAPPPPPPAPTYSEDQLAAAILQAKEEAYAEGMAAGVRQAGMERAQREKDTLSALTRVGSGVEALVATYGGVLTQQSAELSELIYVIAKKVAGEALDQRSMDTIVELVKRCLPIFYEKPRIIIELHSATMDNAKEALRPLLQQHGYEGEVIYRSNDAIGKHDARIDWGNGEALRSTDKIWHEIEQLMHHMPLTPTLPQRTS